MTGILHQLSQQRFTGETGGVVGASIYFYLTATTDFADIYSDPDLSVPLANPVEVAAGEIIPSIYLDPDIVYRRRIEYADGTIFDLDPYSGNSSSAGTVFIESLTDGADDEAERLAEAVAGLTSGQTLQIAGNWLLGSMSELDTIDNVTFEFIPGATFTLEDKTWSDPAAIVIRDCKNFKMLGWPKFDCNYQSVPAVAAVDSASAGFGPISACRSSDHFYQISLTRVGTGTTGVGVRGVSGVVFDRPQGLWKEDSAEFIEGARVERFYVLHPDLNGSLEGGGAQEFGVYSSGVAVSPGGLGTEFDFLPSISYTLPSTFLDSCRRTAPTGTSTATFSFVGDGGVTPPYPTSGISFSDHVWNFICTERPAGAKDIQPSQVVVTSVDSTAKTITCSLYQEDGTTLQNWEGQTIYLYGIRVDRLCKDVHVFGGNIRNNSGAGVFLLGCRGTSIKNLTGQDNIDILADVEWCTDWMLDGNTDLTAKITGTTPGGYPKGNAGMSSLYPVGSGTVSNCVSNKKIDTLMGGEIADVVRFVGNTGPLVIEALLSDAPVLIGTLVVEDHVSSDLVAAINIAPSNAAAPVKGAIKRILIDRPKFFGIVQDCIRINSCGSFKITDAEIDRAGFRMLKVQGRAGDVGEGEIVGTRARGVGGSWLGFPLVSWGGVSPTTSNYPVIYFSDNRIMDETETIGVNRALYGLEDGTVLPSFRRGQGSVTTDLGGASLAAGAVSSWSSNITIPGARAGIDVLKVQPTVYSNFSIEAEIHSDGVGRFRARNVSNTSAGLTETTYIYQVDFR